MALLVQERLIWLELAAVPVRLLGAAGRVIVVALAVLVNSEVPFALNEAI